MALAGDQIEKQRTSNLSAVPYFDSFARHRERLTALLSARHGTGSSERICVLGAGNCYDLDLPRLAASYREIHLVDIDEAALTRAFDRQDAATRARLFLHAPLDLSGFLDRLDAWRDFRVTPEQLTDYPEAASKRIVDLLPAPFDVVVSACILTQMQLSMLNVMTSSHALFEALRQLLNVMHLRTMAKLIGPGGSAILVTDLTSSKLLEDAELEKTADVRRVMTNALEKGNVFYAAHPGLLQWMGREDPVLRRTTRISEPLDVWLWQNGTECVFLVYALELTHVSG